MLIMRWKKYTSIVLVSESIPNLVQNIGGIEGRDQIIRDNLKLSDEGGKGTQI